MQESVRAGAYGTLGSQPLSTRMDNIRQRLFTCFHLVFPDIAQAEIYTASQANVREWDSVATITLVNIIEEEFAIQLDLDQFADLDSFEAIEKHLQRSNKP